MRAHQAVPERNPEGWRESECAKTEIQKGRLRWKHKRKQARFRKANGSRELSKLIEQYGCGRSSSPEPATLSTSATSSLTTYGPTAIGARERFEAVARSVRDVLSQRWVRTEKTYERENPKRVYYLSMEFLIGRSLANNVTNLLLDRSSPKSLQEKNLDWLELLEQEPDAGLGNGGLGRLAACFLDSMATMQIPAMGYGLRYEYGIFKQTIQNGWQHEQPDNWLRRPDPWEVGRSTRRWKSRSTARSKCVAAVCAPSPASHPSDRYPVRSSGGGLWRQDHQHAPALGRGGA